MKLILVKNTEVTKIEVSKHKLSFVVRGWAKTS